MKPSKRTIDWLKRVEICSQFKDDIAGSKELLDLIEQAETKSKYTKAYLLDLLFWLRENLKMKARSTKQHFAIAGLIPIDDAPFSKPDTAFNHTEIDELKSMRDKFLLECQEIGQRIIYLELGREELQSQKPDRPSNVEIQTGFSELTKIGPGALAQDLKPKSDS